MARTRPTFFLLALVLNLPSSAVAQESIGINPDDTVTVATGQGFVLAVVTGRQEHDFKVRIINGPEVIKQYPAEVRRRGRTTAYDRDNGIYDNEDRVQVLYEGKWIDSRVIQSMGMEYQVELPATSPPGPSRSRCASSAKRPEGRGEGRAASPPRTRELRRKSGRPVCSRRGHASADDLPVRQGHHRDDGGKPDRRMLVW